MKSKNFYNKEVPTGNLVTTITGIVTLLISVLVGFGVIDFDMQGPLEEHSVTIVEGIAAIYGAVNAIILMFKATDG